MKKATTIILLVGAGFIISAYFFNLENNKRSSLSIEEVTPAPKTDSLEKEITRYTNSIDNGHTFEVSLYEFSAKPTPKQEEAANNLIQESWDTVLKNGWLSKEHAYQNGYTSLRGDALHSINRKFIYNDKVLNPKEPEVLMYYDTPKGPRLAGVMYFIDDLGSHGPQPGGPLTVWHYHKTEQTDDCVETDKQLIITDCTGGPKDIKPTTNFGPEMLHVWFIEHPQGPFASSMEIWGEPLEQLLDPKFDY